MVIKKPDTVKTIPGVRTKKTDSMYSFTVTHESRNLKQARPDGQYVDLLHKGFALATPSQQL